MFPFLIMRHRFKTGGLSEDKILQNQDVIILRTTAYTRKYLDVYDLDPFKKSQVCT